MQFTMYHHAFVVIAVIVIAFIGAKKFKLNTELTLLTASVAALIAHLVTPMGVDARSALPFTEIIRHFVEGTFTYFDVCMTFLSATFFMTLYKEAGGIVLLRGYKDYYYGYTDNNDKEHPGYVDMIDELVTKFPLTDERIT